MTITMIAQATQAVESVTTESINWQGGFPLGLLIYSMIGAGVATVIWFKNRFDKATDPSTPESLSSAWLIAVATLLTGIAAGFVGTPLIVEWREITSQATTNAIAAGLGAGGIPITERALSLFLGILSRWIPEPPK